MGSHIGALKSAAKRVGISTEEYITHIASGEKWCGGCRVWHRRDLFGVDSTRRDGLMARCFESTRAMSKLRYIPILVKMKKGPLPDPPRDGDRVQARHRINVEVRTGYRPRPNSLPCVDCGHVWAPGEHRHEYDHARGYAAADHCYVEPVCTLCHRRRCEKRGELVQVRGKCGRYASKAKDIT